MTVPTLVRLFADAGDAVGLPSWANGAVAIIASLVTLVGAIAAAVGVVIGARRVSKLGADHHDLIQKIDQVRSDVHPEGEATLATQVGDARALLESNAEHVEWIRGVVAETLARDKERHHP
jgi:hypothetical protein